MNRCKPVVSADVALQLLADQRRRKALQFLANNVEEPVAMDDLATEITDTESTGNGGEGSSADPIVTSLYHVHLPMLHEAGVIEFDPHGSTVLYRSHADIEELLEYVDESFE